MTHTRTHKIFITHAIYCRKFLQFMIQSDSKSKKINYVLEIKKKIFEEKFSIAVV